MTSPGVAAVDGLQQAVDRLAARLGRSVAVDDTHGRLVVASRHFGDEDPLRTYAVMQRSSDSRVIAHFARHGIARWRHPGRVPADEELGFKARVCCPVRSHDIPFGHLFLIDDGVDPVGEGEVELAAGVADEIGLLLYRRLVGRERDHGRLEALARDLLAADPDVRAAAGHALRAEHLVDTLEPAVALSVHLVAHADGDGPDTALRLAFERRTRDRRALASANGRQGTLLLVGAAATDARKLGDEIKDDLGDDGGAGRVVVGVGPACTGPDAARRSHDEARSAAEAAVLLPVLGDVVGPEDLGAYAVLLALPRPAVTADLLPAALRRLVEQDPHGTLVATLEAYLDQCGDATRTATALRIHRSTLYYRLGRIETVAGIDLHDGAQRLALHQGVKLRHLLDAYGDAR